MSDITTKGFSQISFWKEENIGLIVLRSDSRGFCSQNLIKELLEVVSIGYMDDSLDTLAFTGLNNFFLSEILIDDQKESLEEFFEMLHTFIRTIASINKPLFSVINGNATGIGYEFALLTDVLIASDGVMVGFPSHYRFVSLGSLSCQRFGPQTVSRAMEGKNVDFTFPYDDFLADAKHKIHELEGIDYALVRKHRLANFELAMLTEKDKYLRSSPRKKPNLQ